MYYDEHTAYINAYQPKLRKISRRKKFISITKDLELKSVYKPNNYDLFYSSNGYLTHMLEFHYNHENKLKQVKRYQYTYLNDRRLHMILVTDIVKNTICRQIYFYYNKNDQIEEESLYHYYSDDDFYEEQCFHEYNGEYHKMLLVSEENKNNFLFETWYDGLTGTVDEKITEVDNEMLHWTRYVYNKSGLLVHEYDLDATGQITGESEYFYNGNKKINVHYDGCKTVYETLTVEEGNNTTKSHFTNGELIYIEEETKEFNP